MKKINLITLHLSQISLPHLNKAEQIKPCDKDHQKWIIKAQGLPKNVAKQFKSNAKVV